MSFGNFLKISIQEPEEAIVANLSPQLKKRMDNLSEVFSSKKLRKDFQKAFVEAEGNFVAAKEKFSQKKEVDDNVLQPLSFTNEVAELTDDNPKLVSAFHANIKTNSLREIAENYNREELKKLIHTTGALEAVEGEEEEQKLNEFTDKVYRGLFQTEPTAMVKKLLIDPAETPIVDKRLSGSIATFLDNQPESFNIKTTSIYEALRHENAFKGIQPEEREKVCARPHRSIPNLLGLLAHLLFFPTPLLIVADYNLL